MKKIQKQLIIFSLMLGSLPTACFGADVTKKMKEALGGIKLPTGGDNPENYTLNLIGAIIGIVLSLLGVVFFGLIIIAGYKWMMAQGREEEVTKAKDTLKSAIIGLVVIMAAYAITYFITTQLQAAIN